jgi:hypothetical protein
VKKARFTIGPFCSQPFSASAYGFFQRLQFGNQGEILISGPSLFFGAFDRDSCFIHPRYVPTMQLTEPSIHAPRSGHEAPEPTSKNPRVSRTAFIRANLTSRVIEPFDELPPMRLAEEIPKDTKYFCLPALNRISLCSCSAGYESLSTHQSRQPSAIPFACYSTLQPYAPILVVAFARS